MRFRSVPSRQAPARVDREAGILRGVSAIQTGEALGHDMLIDEVMIAQVVSHGQAAGDVGIKSRYTHPGLCADGMGKMLGRLRNWRLSADRQKALADLHLLESAAASPDGDLRTYVLDLAEEDPQAFALSIVFENDPVWKLADGSEIRVYDDSLRRREEDWVWYERPPTATTEEPYARCQRLTHTDTVDEPAANRDGLFATAAAAAAFARGTSAAAEQAYDQLDLLRASLRLSLSDTHAFAMRYLAARGYTSAKGPAMTRSLQGGTPAPAEPEMDEDGNPIEPATDDDDTTDDEPELDEDGNPIEPATDDDDTTDDDEPELDEDGNPKPTEEKPAGDPMTKADYARLASAHPAQLSRLAALDAQGLSAAQVEARLAAEHAKALAERIASLESASQAKDAEIATLRQHLTDARTFRARTESTPDPGSDSTVAHGADDLSDAQLEGEWKALGQSARNAYVDSLDAYKHARRNPRQSRTSRDD